MAEIDYDAIFGTDDYDPCAALTALRPEFMRARVEGSVRTARFRDRLVEFNPNNIANFEALMRELERDCAAKNGRSTGRAIQAGFRQG